MGAISAATPPQHFHTVTVMCDPRSIYIFVITALREEGGVLVNNADVMSGYVTLCHVTAPCHATCEVL